MPSGVAEVVRLREHRPKSHGFGYTQLSLALVGCGDGLSLPAPRHLMADLKKSVPENVPGDFFVDTTCIDCDTCRQLAPAVFAEGPGHAFVHGQPATPADRRQALQALVCCPTGSIGARGGDRPQTVLDD